jgi:protein involved in polysaccharide export with SLBB domain
MNRRNLFALTILLSVTSFAQVRLTDSETRFYIITGDVERPGIYPLLASATLVGDAITRAGGFHSWNAENNDAVIIKRETMTLHYQILPQERGIKVAGDSLLKDRDWIIVEPMR